MVKGVPADEPEAQRRRSTRIFQAVPLTVTGEDALGQPFKERTSTTLVNCHGCKYQSKHYVLKNAWLTLEIPHPEAGQEPRRVRGRVTWVQRPRTLRELFQVAVELEVPGNIWGIAFPPEDWFPFPEPAAPVIPAPAAKQPPMSAEPPVSLPAEKVRVLPSPAAVEISATLAHQMRQLVIEAKQEIEKAAREAAASAATAETAQLLREVNAQIQNVAGKAGEAAAARYIDEATRSAVERIDEARQATARSLQQQWDEEFERLLGESSQALLARLGEAGETFGEDFVKQLESALGRASEQLKLIEHRIQELEAQIGASTEAGEARFAQLRKETEEAAEAARQQWLKQLRQAAEQAEGRFGELEEAARKLSGEIAPATDAAHAGWRDTLDSELRAASARWNELVESSLTTATRQLAERLEQLGQTSVATTEHEIAARASALRQSFAEAAAETQQTLASVQAALEQDVARTMASLLEMNAAATRVEESAAKLEEMKRSVSEELNRKLEAVLAAHSARLNQHSESIIASLADRLQPTLEAAGAETVARFVSQTEQQLAPHLERAQQAAEKLVAGEGRAEEILHAQRERLREASEEYMRELLARIQDTVAQIQSQFEQGSRTALANWLEELEQRGTDTTHTTFEALYKASEWYQKKAQTSMQAALDKALEQASNGLREKAGEISSVFASELDHYSRSYVEHTQGLLEESSKELLERSRSQIDRAAEVSATTFDDHTHRIAEQKLQSFAEASSRTLDERAAQLDARAQRVRAQLDADAERSFSEFQRRMAERLEQGIAQARLELQAALLPIVESWRAETEAQQRRWLDNLGRRSEESMGHHQQRLENVSNTWLVASVAKLNEHSLALINSLAKAAEQRLRETCAQVVAGWAEGMRQRLLGISADLQAAIPPSEKK